LSKLYITLGNGSKVVGYFSLNPLDDVSLSINWDADTYTSNTQLTTNNRASAGTFDAIIDPKKTGPNDPKLPTLAAGSRYLIVDNIGGGIRETVTSENSIQRINTDILYSKVADEYTKVFVDGVPVTFSSLVPNNTETGNYIIVLDALAPAGSEISYELYKNDPGVDQGSLIVTPGGPDAWKNADGSDFIAEENDVIEWNGNKWSVIFSASENTDQITYLTNIFTGTQYVWNGQNWGKSFEGVYRKGNWYLEL
jgi:hypothetical protein